MYKRQVLQAFEENGSSFEHVPSGIDTMTVFVHQDAIVRTESVTESMKNNGLQIEKLLSLIHISHQFRCEKRYCNGSHGGERSR